MRLEFVRDGSVEVAARLVEDKRIDSIAGNKFVTNVSVIDGIGTIEEVIDSGHKRKPILEVMPVF